MSRSIIEASLADHETLVRFRTGETLFLEGQQPRGVYVLHSGTVNLLFAGKNGAAKALREAQPGQILGLSCVVTQRVHDCTATAATPCDVAFIERNEFLRTLDDSPAVWFSVLRILSSEVNAAYDDMRMLAAR
ncbi:MAG TPA: cyclic nucleotide-binding domain-containing protein [Thermoanaerobaculia bacterium]